MFPKTKKNLLTEDSIQVLQDIICSRDQTNDVVSCKETVVIVSNISQAKSPKQAENHLDYLIRAGQLKRLKRNGRIITAQATTTERSQINVRQQLCWHFHIDGEWEYLQSANKPLELFVQLQEHFQLNLDESCFMCSDGELKIIGNAEKKRHDKNNSDNRVSITTV